MSDKFKKFQAFRQGSFLNWLTSFQTGGSAGDLQITDDKIKWKSAFMNFGGKFEYDLDQIKSIDKSKYLNFLIIPSQCFQFNFKDGKSYKFTFSFSGGKSNMDEKVKSLFSSKETTINF
jgi:hypothetical protein